MNVVGAGIFGLWQAYQLALDGLTVALFEKSQTPFSQTASRMAGAMLAPYCEAEASDQRLIPLALQSLDLWRSSPFDVTERGTLIVAPARDKIELTAFAKRTKGYQRLNHDDIAALESDLTGRFDEALFYADEAHLSPRPVMHALLEACLKLGVDVKFGFEGALPQADYVIDARGMEARDMLSNLRPVRGEMAVVELKELGLSRPVRLLHPRVPCYIVPWPDHQYMIGATVIESDDKGPVSVRSALELLGAAFTLHPGFGQAKIIELSAGARPSFPDNSPKICIKKDRIFVNGAYRHGFLLAPLLAYNVSSYIREGVCDEELIL